MEIKRLEIAEAQKFIDFFDQLVAQTNYLLPTIQEAYKPVEKQRDIIHNLNDFKQIFIALENNQIVGFIGLTRVDASKIKHISNFALGVLEEHRRKGIASKLFQAAESWLKEKGVFRFEMTVICDNIPAIRFYKKMGFKEEGRRQKSIFMNEKYYDELYMAKFI